MTNTPPVLLLLLPSILLFACQNDAAIAPIRKILVLMRRQNLQPRIKMTKAELTEQLGTPMFGIVFASDAHMRGL